MEFAEDVGDVVFDGAFGQDEFVGDVAVAGSGGEEFEDFDFAGAEFFFGEGSCKGGGGAAFAAKYDKEFAGDFGLDEGLGLPLPAGEVPVAAFYGESGGVVGRRDEFLQGPAGGFLGVFAAVEEGGGFAGEERDVELVEEDVDAFASGFDVGFFTGPAVVKGVVLEVIG